MARIFLVEDDADVRAVIERALSDCGHEVAATSDYATAERAVLHAAFDLLITDVSLPGGSGRGLGQEAALRGVPTLFITGDFGHMTALEAEGASLLRKPFRLQALHDAVSDLLGAAGAVR